VFFKCNGEFWFRYLLLTARSMLITQYLNSKGTLLFLISYGSTPKLMFICIMPFL
ncbi:hypothetical protein DBR06_SOUSAS8810026, partial [Sousa chinensis]